MPLRSTRPSRDVEPAGWLQRLTRRRPADAPSTAPAPELPPLLLDALPGAVLVLDAEGRIQLANAAAETLTGHPSADLIGTTFDDTLLPETARAAWRARLADLVDGAPPADTPESVVLSHAGGQAVRATATLRAVPATNGVLILTGLQAAPPPPAEPVIPPALVAERDAARIRNRILRTIVDSIPDPVVAVDRAGRVVFRNRSSETEPTMLGPTPERLNEVSWARADAVMRVGDADVDREEAADDGRVHLTTRVPVRSPAGDVLGLVAISRDVTAQKEAEARLLEDKRAAEAAAQANSDFLATTSHEIRTLMNGVTGMTTLLLGTDLDEEQRDFVDTVQSSSDALLTLINDILDFSKIKAGLMALEDRAFSVRSTLRNALAMVGQQAGAKGLALDSLVPDTIPDEAFGDATRIQQVLVNLLSNAVKFTEHGRVRVHVGLDAPDGGKPTHLAFSVEDTGIGIPADRLAAVFERFAQADASTARVHGGTGLGLSICRHLAEMMGGTLTATSEPGQGSIFRFTVAVRFSAAPPRPAAPDPSSAWVAVPAPAPVPHPHLPAVVAPAPEPEPEAPVKTASVMSTASILPAARVLLVEDNPINQKVTALTLKRLGYQPDVVSDGVEAVAAVRRDPYDLVLMDVMMPGMDGLTATRHIRAHPGPHPPPAIVALTANALEGDRDMCLEAGCDDYLSKPVAPRMLASTIERAIRARAGVPLLA